MTLPLLQYHLVGSGFEAMLDCHNLKQCETEKRSCMPYEILEHKRIAFQVNLTTLQVRTIATDGLYLYALNKKRVP